MLYANSGQINYYLDNSAGHLIFTFKHPNGEVQSNYKDKCIYYMSFTASAELLTSLIFADTRYESYKP